MGMKALALTGLGMGSPTPPAPPSTCTHFQIRQDLNPALRLQKAQLAAPLASLFELMSSAHALKGMSPLFIVSARHDMALFNPRPAVSGLPIHEDSAAQGQRISF